MTEVVAVSDDILTSDATKASAGSSLPVQREDGFHWPSESLESCANPEASLAASPGARHRGNRLVPKGNLDTKLPAARLCWQPARYVIVQTAAAAQFIYPSPPGAH